MKQKRHTPEQIIKKLREADTMLAAGKTISQVAQALGVSEQIPYEPTSTHPTLSCRSVWTARSTPGRGLRSRCSRSGRTAPAA
jgi:hypothetical protein